MEKKESMKEKDKQLQRILDINREIKNKVIEIKKIKVEIDKLSIEAQEISQELKTTINQM